MKGELCSPVFLKYRILSGDRQLLTCSRISISCTVLPSVFGGLALLLLFSSALGKNVNRPQLLPYNPAAASAAVVVATDGMARFTVLTDRLIRMEYAFTKVRCVIIEPHTLSVQRENVVPREC